MELNWEAVARATAHPTKVVILERMAVVGGDLSPAEIARAVGGDVGHVGYHMRALAEGGFVTLTRTGQVRGAIEHFYKLTKKAKLTRRAGMA